MLVILLSRKSTPTVAGRLRFTALISILASARSFVFTNDTLAWGVARKNRSSALRAVLELTARSEAYLSKYKKLSRPLAPRRAGPKRSQASNLWLDIRREVLPRILAVVEDVRVEANSWDGKRRREGHRSHLENRVGSRVGPLIAGCLDRGRHQPADQQADDCRRGATQHRRQWPPEARHMSAAPLFTASATKRSQSSIIRLVCDAV